MPNGHGGIMRYGAPVIIFIIMLVVFFNEDMSATKWYRPTLLALSVLFGWKLSLHLHMWRALEYGGAYINEVELRRARIRFVTGVVCYSVITSLTAWLLTA